jgi:uncharacterized protein (TIGR02300 family)
LTAALQAAKGSTTFLFFFNTASRIRTVAKPELGTKRLCASCGAKFYDLNKDPIVCPKCETVFQVVIPLTRGGRDAAAAAAAAASARAPAAVADVEAPETQDAEFVSLEDADAEASGGKKSDDAVDGDDLEIESDDDESLDDSTFIQETEEGDDDVTGIIGEGREDEEET